MPIAGLQHIKTADSGCNCHHDADNISPFNNTLPPKEESKATHSDYHNEISTGLMSKLSTDHGWEAHSRFDSRINATRSMLPPQDQLNSPTHSDLTYEDGIFTDLQRDSSLNIAQINPTPFSTSNSSIRTERVYGSSNIQIANESKFARMDGNQIDDVLIHEAANQKECRTSWTDEKGKLAIQSDIFDAVLSSTDEVGMQWRISELRIALRASESARLESEQETEALRKYLAEVEAAAAGLQSRVQELEHLITFSTKEGNWELEQLRAKIITEVSKESRSQTMKAAKAVAAAREATMELDKIKRHASSVIKAQEEEVERLRMEAAECRTLYHARAGQLQGMRERVEKLEQDLKVSNNSSTEALKLSQEEVVTLKKSLDAVKIDCHDKAIKLADVLEDLETRTKTLQAAENRLKDLEKERAELTRHNEWLEQQMKDLESEGIVAAAADYDHELCKVKAMLGAEKQQLLSELTMLRQGNQSLQEKMMEWQEKYHALKQHMSMLGPQSVTKTGMNSRTRRDNPDMQNTKGKSYQDPDCFEYAKSSADEGVEGHECLSQTTETIRSSSLCSCHKSHSKHNSGSSNGHYSCHSKESGRKTRGLQLRPRSKNNSQSCSLLKDDLLSAAHREIVKLKEINQCLMTGREGKIWHGNIDTEKENYTY